MTRLLDDLLEVSRITQNKIELRKQVLDMRSVVTEAVFALRERFHAKRIEVKPELPDLPLQIEADPARLQQIIVNLLDNAAKYGRIGGLVNLRLAQEGELALLQVQDDGAGIDPAMLNTIFEPFVQGRATIHRTEGGMGLGLSVVRSLVEMHGGTIRAESSGPVHGSLFTVSLPTASSGCATAPSRGRSVAWPVGKRVVVIEDNVDGCELLQLLLTQAGYEVFCALDGRSGLSLIEQQRPHLAIVDIGLPEMDGFEVARRVRAQSIHDKLFLVALTGYGQDSDRRAALEAGFNQHLVKPLNPDELTRLMSGASAA
jgi:two-component system CheB/CheR fusion protein